MFMISIESSYPVDEGLYATILEEIQLLQDALKQGYDTPYGAFYAPQDSHAIDVIKNLALTLQKSQPTLLMLVGIGGSNMGTLAVAQALLGNFNGGKGIKFYCADTIDNDYTQELLKIFEDELMLGGSVILCIVTKSGTTAETIINAALFYELLKKYRPNDYAEHTVYITDASSPLVTVAVQQGSWLLEIPKNVGGRFSVFTAVGLFPLALLGIDIDDFCRGAAVMLSEMLEHGEKSEAARTAATLFSHYERGYVIHDIFPFTPEFVFLAQWYKQLIGESLGKKYDLAGRLVEVGITPTVSIGTTDLHSVVQLYLAGPHNRITTFIKVLHESENVVVPDNELGRIIPGLARRSVTFIKNAIFTGVTAAYKKESRPFMIVELPDKSSYHLGAFMMMKMIETLFLARLFSINPFDQPAVELYKEETRRVLY
jgi:glucose-6-phosphate isomerase